MSENPFVRYRERLDSYEAVRVGRDVRRGVRRHRRRTLDAAVADVDGHRVPHDAGDRRLGPAARSRRRTSDLSVKVDVGNVAGFAQGPTPLRRRRSTSSSTRPSALPEAERLAIASCGNAALGAATLARALDRPIDVFIPTLGRGHRSSTGSQRARSGRASMPSVAMARSATRAYLRFREAVERPVSASVQRAGHRHAHHARRRAHARLGDRGPAAGSPDCHVRAGRWGSARHVGSARGTCPTLACTRCRPRAARRCDVPGTGSHRASTGTTPLAPPRSLHDRLGRPAELRHRASSTTSPTTGFPCCNADPRERWLAGRRTRTPRAFEAWKLAHEVTDVPVCSTGTAGLAGLLMSAPTAARRARRHRLHRVHRAGVRP